MPATPAATCFAILCCFLTCPAVARAAEPALDSAAAPGFATADYVTLIVYLGALVAMGWHFSRREKTTHDFFLAGRRIPWWAAGLSVFGTQLSAITFMAIPGKAYATDWVLFQVNMCIVLIAPIVVLENQPIIRRHHETTL